MNSSLNYREALFKSLMRFILSNCLCGPRLEQVLRLGYALSYNVYFFVSIVLFLSSNVHTKETVLECFFQFACFVANVHCFISSSKKSKIMPLIDNALVIFDYPDEEPELQALYRENRVRQEELLKNFIKITFILYTGVAMSLSLPMFLSLFVEKFALISYEQLFILELWKPYEVNKLSGFLLTYSVHLTIMLSMCFSGFSVLLLYCYMNETCKLETNTLISLIERTDRSVSERVGAQFADDDSRSADRSPVAGYDAQQSEYRRAEEDAIFHRLMLNFLLHHRSLHKYATDSIEAFRSAVMMMVTGNFLFFVSLICLAVENEIPAKLVSWIIGIVIEGIVLWVISQTGENYIAVNDKFRTALYEKVSWYDRSAAVQKFVLQIITLTTQDLHISASPDVYLSYIFYASLMRTAYTLISFLLNVKN